MSVTPIPPSMYDSTPEQVAAEAVTVADGHVVLRGPGLPPVHLCGHPNPALVTDDADSLRAVVAAVVRDDRAGR